jgi:hypothetical protein
MSSHHVVALPRWFLVLRIFQILIAVAVLGMCAYGIYWIPYNVCDSNSASPCSARTS